MTSRRALLASSFALQLRHAAAAPVLVKPKALRRGDTVGLITPSTYVSDPERLMQAERLANYLGLKPRFGKNVRRRAGYLGGSIEERLDDLHAMFADPEVKAVFAIRGGYGSAQLLDRIDYGLIQRNPKIFVGYSDITALHLAIHQRTGLVTFHGPVALSRFGEYTLSHFQEALFSTRPLGVLKNPPEANPIVWRHPVRALRAGKAAGALIGGNLSLVASTMGTPFEIQTEGKVLFLEDVDEQPYSMDRMLTQLRLAGKFKGIRALLVGECANCRPRDYQPSFDSTFSLPEVLDEVLGNVQAPVLSGLVIGHTEDQLTLPLGVRATLDAGEATLTLEEPALVP